MAGSFVIYVPEPTPRLITTTLERDLNHSAHSQMVKMKLTPSMYHSVDCSTVQELAIRGIQRRSELPQRQGLAAAVTTSGKIDVVPFIDCPGFMRRGACPEFNQRKRCSHHHPFDVHIVETPKPRCPQVRFNLTLTTFKNALCVAHSRRMLTSCIAMPPAPMGGTSIGFNLAVGMFPDPTAVAER